MATEYFTPQVEIDYANNVTINSATFVRIYNGFGDVAKITINDNSGASPVNLGSFTMASNTATIIKKEPAHEVNVAASATDVKMTQVDF
jgi:predicted PhzF superfamily epimerase YddE/YHI9